MENSKIEIKITKDLNATEMTKLYKNEGWFSADAPETLVQPILNGSFAICGAFDSGRLVGMMRAISDGVSDAYILDLVVDKEYRGRKIGAMVLEHLVEHLQSLNIDWIVCIGAPGTDKFYAKSSATIMENYTPMRFFSKEK